MTPLRVAITTSSFAASTAPHRQRLKDAKIEVVENPYGRKLTEAESIVHLQDVVGVLAGTSPLNTTVLAAAPHLQVISRVGVGTDNVDLEYTKEKDIALYITPEAPSQAVAELTMGLILSSLRRIAEADRQLRAGVWKPLTGRLLHGKTIGIVGLGYVGRQLVKLLHPYGVTLLVADPVMPPADFIQHYGIQVQDLNVLFQEADIISLHVPYNRETHHLVNANRLRQMKPSAVIVNAARGGVVDEKALLQAIDKGWIGGAALDTFMEEPYNGPLTTRNNVVLTNHMGSAAQESRTKMEAEAVDNLILGLCKKGVLDI